MSERIEDLADSLGLALRAGGRSQRTVTLRVGSVLAFARWLDARGHSGCIDDVTADDIRRWVIEMGEQGRKATTVSTHLNGVRCLYAWAVAEGVATENPTRRVKVPRPVAAPVPILNDKDLHALIGACIGPTPKDRRDEAIVRVLADTGLRRAELCGLALDDLDLRARTFSVRRGKGGRPRVVAFSDRTAASLDRWLRARKQSPFHDAPDLWLSRNGPGLTFAALRDILMKRARKAGIPPLHAHMLRHGWASAMLSAGVSEGDVMSLGGWSSAAMLHTVYGKVAQADRAIASARKVAIGDRF